MAQQKGRGADVFRWPINCFTLGCEAKRTASAAPMTDKSDPLAANAAYYRAFCDRDLDAMAQVWAEDKVSCIHPGWAALVDRKTILASFQEIFRNPHQEQIETQGEYVIVDGDDARVICVEKVADATLVATNQFRRKGQGWRLVHHQASPLVVAPVAAPAPRRSMH
jgi:ketosteroid isomerase-like protein